MISSDEKYWKAGPLAKSMVQPMQVAQSAPLAVAQAPNNPSMASQLAKKAAMSAAQKGLAKSGLKAAATAAGGPAGGIAAEVGSELLPQLLGSFFKSGGRVKDVSKGLIAPLAKGYKHGGQVDKSHDMPLRAPSFRELVGNRGPLSKVKYKKTGGEVVHEYETNYHNPLEVKEKKDAKKKT